MRIRALSKSCLLLLVAWLLVSCVVVFVGSILITQSASSLDFPTAMPSSTVQPTVHLSATIQNSAPMTIAAPVIHVTVEVMTTATDGIAATSTPDSIAVMTVTPSFPANMPGNTLGTLDYPLTVTAESQIQGTKVNAYRSSINATRTAAAERGLLTKTALTATAGAPKP
jgi:hypothetical protein